MNRLDIDNLVTELQRGDLSRRGFMHRATALGLSAGAAGMLVTNAMAQGSTPTASPGASPVASPIAGGEVIRSISREEALQEIEDFFGLEEAQNEGGTLVHTETSDISTVNTVLTTDVYSSWIAGFIYDGLIGSSPATGRIVPLGLAESWEIAEDGVTYTVKLREDVTWHDGEPFTADDVIFTFDMALAEDSQSVRKATIEGVLESYEKIDDYTVQFNALAPSALFLSDALGQFGIMPEHIWADVPASEWPTDPGSTGQDPSRVIGTGPFKFVEWVLGDHVTLEKNPDYWGKVPHIDTYTFQVLTDPASRIAALQTGAADLIEVPFTQANLLRESNPELQIVDYDTLSFNFYHVNQDPAKEELFTDVRVRQALQYALNRELMAETIYEGFAIQADGTQPVLSIAYDPERINTIYDYDPELAMELLESAGWVDTDGDGIREKDGETLSFEMIYTEGVGTYEQQVPYMQQAWREVGIEMIPVAIPFPTLLELTDTGNYQMALQGFNWTVLGDQDAMFACDMAPPAGFNNMRYCNPEYDALIEASKRELDVEKRIEILIEMSNIVNDDAAIGITVFRKDIYGASPRLHNFFPTGYGEMWWLPWAWLEEA